MTDEYEYQNECDYIDEVTDLELDDDVKITPADELDKYPIIKRYIRDDDDMEKIKKMIKEENEHNIIEKGGKK